MASYTIKRLTNPTQLGTAASSIYTVSGVGLTVAVRQLMVSNVSGSSVNFSMHVVPSGGIASASNLMSPAVPVAPNSFILIDLNQVLTNGDALSAFASAATSINVMVTGYEVTA
jgi:hypothetical protein